MNFNSLKSHKAKNNVMRIVLAGKEFLLKYRRGEDSSGS
jgi:hypothetical protein